jgi:hypothetical protein
MPRWIQVFQVRREKYARPFVHAHCGHIAYCISSFQEGRLKFQKIKLLDFFEDLPTKKSPWLVLKD